ncbi:hypothetical protein GMMP1_1600006 [Candidatus Magnetomoraceae bacterium gMMP-1]
MKKSIIILTIIFGTYLPLPFITVEDIATTTNPDMASHYIKKQKDALKKRFDQEVAERPSAPPVHAKKSVIEGPKELSKKTDKTDNYIVCLSHGGTPEGIIKKYNKLERLLTKDFRKKLWIVKISHKPEKFALVIDNKTSRKKIVDIASAVAIQIKGNQRGSFDKFATPIKCKQIHEIRFKPKLNLCYKQKINKNLKYLLAHIKNAQNFLNQTKHKILAKEGMGSNDVFIAVYDMKFSDFICIRVPTNVRVFKDDKSGLVIVKESGIGVGSIYYVGNATKTNDDPCQYFVPAIAYPIYEPNGKITHVVNTPFSEDINTDEMVAYGFNYLKELAEDIIKKLKHKEIPSHAFKGKNVDEAVSNDLLTMLIALNIIEQMDAGLYTPYIDYSRYKARKRIKRWNVKRNQKKVLDKLMKKQIRSILITLAANGENAYKCTMSDVGARGLPQIMKPTYDGLVRLYPKAGLNQNFFEGTRNHSNGVLAQALHLEAELAALFYDQSIKKEYQKAKNRQKINFYEVLMAGYNSSAPKLRKILKKAKSTRNWIKHLPKETQLYVLKARFVKKWIQNNPFQHYALNKYSPNDNLKAQHKDQLKPQHKTAPNLTKNKVHEVVYLSKTRNFDIDDNFNWILDDFSDTPQFNIDFNKNFLGYSVGLIEAQPFRAVQEYYEKTRLFKNFKPGYY